LGEAREVFKSVTIVFMRHGKAEEAKAGVSDWERSLTADGRRVVECVAKHVGLKPDVILTSPLVRAVETAEITSKALGGIPVIKEWALEPESFSFNELESLIMKYVGKTLMLVGHSPSMESIVATVLGCESFKIPPAGVVGVEIIKLEPKGGLLKFYLTPEVLKCV